MLQETIFAVAENDGTEELSALPGTETLKEVPERGPLTSEDLEYYKALLEEKRKLALDDIARMRADIADSRASDDSNPAYSSHPADAGTDAMMRNQYYLMIARQEKFIFYLNNALLRIKNGTYGTCHKTGGPISRERLESVPHATTSISAKKAQTQTKQSRGRCIKPGKGMQWRS